MSEKFNFSQDFQDLLIGCVVKHPQKFLYYTELMKPVYFTGVERVIAMRSIIDYHTKYGRFPSLETFGQIVYDKLIADDQTESVEDAMNYVNRIKSLDVGDSDYVLEKVRSFAVNSACKVVLNKVIGLMKDGKEPPIDLPKMFEDALAVGKNMDDTGIFLYDDIDKIIDKVTANSYGVRTGYPLLDNVWKNGWGPGWLIVPLAPPKRYKTAFCINLAMNITGPAIGQPVFYYACEISEELTGFRALTNLTGLTSDYAYEYTEKFRAEAHKTRISEYAAPLVIKSFTSKSATINDIRQHAKMIVAQYGILPKAIVIDYAETVQPSGTNEKTSDWRRQAQIYVEARALGAELGCCVIMPDRCNKETIDKQVPNMASFQGAFEKAGIVDIAIGLCATDEEYAQNILRFFICINRHGKGHGHYKGKVIPELMRISIDEEIEYDPNAEEEKKSTSRGKKKSSPKYDGEDFEVDAEVAPPNALLAGSKSRRKKAT